MAEDIHKIVLIGAGNLATQLGLALFDKGFDIVQVYSRTLEAARNLADQTKALFTNNLAAITPVADLYIYAIKDDALQEVINNVSVKSGLHVHTSGSLPIDVFRGKRELYGVFYPLQTFKKEKRVVFDDIPIFLEASDGEITNNMKVIANKISKSVFEAKSEDRKFIHLSAVFACNFTNHCYAIAEKILQPTGLPFSAMQPLIREGIEKLQTLTPEEAQTGPAVRNDTNVINKHLEMLKNQPDLAQLYQQMTEHIQTYHKQKSE
ncbi:MAG: DUF2520 domain-containing protein [Sphingobacteriia bacterium]|jgi:predicted short-subunit dehydrogenase-like oxidoreductase (DUF2520 family)|nr:DUF2520 domain-containing protein [Sphingobacteriia bacterium]